MTSFSIASMICPIDIEAIFHPQFNFTDVSRLERVFNELNTIVSDLETTPALPQHHQYQPSQQQIFSGLHAQSTPKPPSFSNLPPPSNIPLFKRSIPFLKPFRTQLRVQALLLYQICNLHPIPLQFKAQFVHISIRLLLLHSQLSVGHLQSIQQHFFTSTSQDSFQNLLTTTTTASVTAINNDSNNFSSNNFSSNLHSNPQHNKSTSVLTSTNTTFSPLKLPMSQSIVIIRAFLRCSQLWFDVLSSHVLSLSVSSASQSHEKSHYPPNTTTNTSIYNRNHRKNTNSKKNPQSQPQTIINHPNKGPTDTLLTHDFSTHQDQTTQLYISTIFELFYQQMYPFFSFFCDISTITPRHPDIVHSLYYTGLKTLIISDNIHTQYHNTNHVHQIHKNSLNNSANASQRYFNEAQSDQDTTNNQKSSLLAHLFVLQAINNLTGSFCAFGFAETASLLLYAMQQQYNDQESDQILQNISANYPNDLKIELPVENEEKMRQGEHKTTQMAKNTGKIGKNTTKQPLLTLYPIPLATIHDSNITSDPKRESNANIREFNGNDNEQRLEKFHQHEHNLPIPFFTHYFTLPSPLFFNLQAEQASLFSITHHCAHKCLKFMQYRSAIAWVYLSIALSTILLGDDDKNDENNQNDIKSDEIGVKMDENDQQYSIQQHTNPMNVKTDLHFDTTNQNQNYSNFKNTTLSTNPHYYTQISLLSKLYRMLSICFYEEKQYYHATHAVAFSLGFDPNDSNTFLYSKLLLLLLEHIYSPLSTHTAYTAPNCDHIDTDQNTNHSSSMHGDELTKINEQSFNETPQKYSSSNIITKMNKNLVDIPNNHTYCASIYFPFYPSSLKCLHNDQKYCEHDQNNAIPFQDFSMDTNDDCNEINSTFEKIHQKITPQFVFRTVYSTLSQLSSFDLCCSLFASLPFLSVHSNHPYTNNTNINNNINKTFELNGSFENTSNISTSNHDNSITITNTNTNTNTSTTTDNTPIINNSTNSAYNSISFSQSLHSLLLFRFSTPLTTHLSQFAQNPQNYPWIHSKPKFSTLLCQSSMSTSSNELNYTPNDSNLTSCFENNPNNPTVIDVHQNDAQFENISSNDHYMKQSISNNLNESQKQSNQLIINHIYLHWLLEQNAFETALQFISTITQISEQSLQLIWRIIIGFLVQNKYKECSQWSHSLLSLLHLNDYYNRIITYTIYTQTMYYQHEYQSCIDFGTTGYDLVKKAQKEGYILPHQSLLIPHHDNDNDSAPYSYGINSGYDSAYEPVYDAMENDEVINNNKNNDIHDFDDDQDDNDDNDDNDDDDGNDTTGAHLSSKITNAPNAPNRRTNNFQSKVINNPDNNQDILEQLEIRLVVLLIRSYMGMQHICPQNDGKSTQISYLQHTLHYLQQLLTLMPSTDILCLIAEEVQGYTAQLYVTYDNDNLASNNTSKNQIHNNINSSLQASMIIPAQSTSIPSTVSSSSTTFSTKLTQSTTTLKAISRLEEMQILMFSRIIPLILNTEQEIILIIAMIKLLVRQLLRLVQNDDTRFQNEPHMNQLDQNNENNDNNKQYQKMSQMVDSSLSPQLNDSMHVSEKRTTIIHILAQINDNVVLFQKKTNTTMVAQDNNSIRFLFDDISTILTYSLENNPPLAFFANYQNGHNNDQISNQINNNKANYDYSMNIPYDKNINNTTNPINHTSIASLTPNSSLFPTSSVSLQPIPVFHSFSPQTHSSITIEDLIIISQCIWNSLVISTQYQQYDNTISLLISNLHLIAIIQAKIMTYRYYTLSQSFFSPDELSGDFSGDIIFTNKKNDSGEKWLLNGQNGQIGTHSPHSSSTTDLSPSYSNNTDLSASLSQNNDNSDDNTNLEYSKTISSARKIQQNSSQLTPQTDHNNLNNPSMISQSHTKLLTDYTIQSNNDKLTLLTHHTIWSSTFALTVAIFRSVVLLSTVLEYTYVPSHIQFIREHSSSPCNIQTHNHQPCDVLKSCQNDTNFVNNGATIEIDIDDDEGDEDYYTHSHDQNHVNAPNNATMTSISSTSSQLHTSSSLDHHQDQYIQFQPLNLTKSQGTTLALTILTTIQHIYTKFATFYDTCTVNLQQQQHYQYQTQQKQQYQQEYHEKQHQSLVLAQFHFISTILFFRLHLYSPSINFNLNQKILDKSQLFMTGSASSASTGTTTQSRNHKPLDTHCNPLQVIPREITTECYNNLICEALNAKKYSTAQVLLEYRISLISLSLASIPPLPACESDTKHHATKLGQNYEITDKTNHNTQDNTNHSHIADLPHDIFSAHNFGDTPFSNRIFSPLCQITLSEIIILFFQLILVQQHILHTNPLGYIVYNTQTADIDSNNTNNNISKQIYKQAIKINNDGYAIESTLDDIDVDGITTKKDGCTMNDALSHHDLFSDKCTQFHTDPTRIILNTIHQMIQLCEEYLTLLEKSFSLLVTSSLSSLTLDMNVMPNINKKNGGNMHNSSKISNNSPHNSLSTTSISFPSSLPPSSSKLLSQFISHHFYTLFHSSEIHTMVKLIYNIGVNLFYDWYNNKSTLFHHQLPLQQQSPPSSQQQLTTVIEYYTASIKLRQILIIQPYSLLHWVSTIVHQFLPTSSSLTTSSLAVNPNEVNTMNDNTPITIPDSHETNDNDKDIENVSPNQQISARVSPSPHHPHKYPPISYFVINNSDHMQTNNSNDDNPSTMITFAQFYFHRLDPTPQESQTIQIALDSCVQTHTKASNKMYGNVQ